MKNDTPSVSNVRLSLKEDKEEVFSSLSLVRFTSLRLFFWKVHTRGWNWKIQEEYEKNLLINGSNLTSHRFSCASSFICIYDKISATTFCLLLLPSWCHFFFPDGRMRKCREKIFFCMLNKVASEKKSRRRSSLERCSYVEKINYNVEIMLYIFFVL